MIKYALGIYHKNVFFCLGKTLPSSHSQKVNLHNFYLLISYVTTRTVTHANKEELLLSCHKVLHLSFAVAMKPREPCAIAVCICHQYVSPAHVWSSMFRHYKARQSQL